MSTATDILGKIGEKVGGEIKTINSSITNHTGASNPHNITKSTVGLGNVDNVSVNTFAGSANITTLGNITSGSIPYSLLSSVPNLNSVVGNFSIGGNLSVAGTTTTIDTETLVVEDNIIEVNLKSDGTETAQTGGIQINRGEAVASVTETLGNGIASFVATPVGGYLNTIKWKQDGSSNFTIFAVANSTVTGNESDSHIGKLQDGGNYIASVQGEYLVFDFDSNGNLLSIDTYSPNGSVRRIIGFNHVGGVEDKASIIWDDNTGQSMFKFGLGSADADIKTKDVYVSGCVKVPNSYGIKINNVSLGDYSTFESAFNSAKS